MILYLFLNFPCYVEVLVRSNMGLSDWWDRIGMLKNSDQLLSSIKKKLQMLYEIKYKLVIYSTLVKSRKDITFYKEKWLNHHILS